MQTKFNPIDLKRNVRVGLPAASHNTPGSVRILEKEERKRQDACSEFNVCFYQAEKRKGGRGR